MHLLAEQTVTVFCPVAAAYAYVTNMEHFGEWFPGVRSIVSANTLAHAQLGKEYLETVAVPNRGERKIKIRVKEAQLNKLFVTEGDFPPLLPRMEIIFQPQDAQTCGVTWRMFSRNNSFLARLTLLPIARRVIGKRAALGVIQLRQRLEAHPG